MIVYQLVIRGGEYDADGEDFDEWFGSLSAAKRRRTALIKNRESEFKYGHDYEIKKIEITNKLSPRRLVLAILNRRGFVSCRDVVVEPYEPPPKKEET